MISVFKIIKKNTSGKILLAFTQSINHSVFTSHKPFEIPMKNFKDLAHTRLATGTEKR
jgi:hypothetical protein